MAKWCPITEDVVLYLECNECEDKHACKAGLLSSNEEGDEKEDVEYE